MNDLEGIDVRQPRSYLERAGAAGRLCSLLKTRLPVLVDGLENEVSEAYAAFPERLYVIDTNGRVVFKGGRGPVGFDPHELDTAILLTLLSERGSEAVLAR